MSPFFSLVAPANKASEGELALMGWGRMKSSEKKESISPNITL